MKILLFIFIGLFFNLLSLHSEEQAYLRLHIKGIKYDSLQLVIRTHEESHRISGITTDNQNWLFLYSDSIYERHTHMNIEAQNTDSLIQILGFFIPISGQDTLRVGYFSFERRAVINAQFFLTDRSENVPFFRGRDAIWDVLLVSYNDDKELSLMASSSVGNVYSRFSGGFNDLSYDEVLKRTIEITAAHPSSQYLIARVVSSLNNFRNKDDIKKVFHHFSDDNKSSYFGRKISRFLHTTFFENIYLPSWDTGQIEPIIQDTTKYTLVVFSASWCAPCHRLIPVLKEIHCDLSDYLTIVYISTDEQETVQNWRNLMTEKEIPWRSLLTASNTQGVRERYFIQAIPYALLVHPNGKMERLGVDIRRVYEIVNRD